MIVRYFFFFIILTFYACSSNENVLLELALDNSGENRSELEAVLDHYKDNQKKQEAARFLISNMIGKQVLDSNSVKETCVFRLSLIIERHTVPFYMISNTLYMIV